MPYQFRIARSWVGLIRLVGRPPRTTRLGEVVKADVLPAGLADRQPIPSGYGGAVTVAPASASRLLLSGASASPSAVPIASASASPVAPGSGQGARLPVPAATSASTPTAQAKAAPPSQAQASHSSKEKLMWLSPVSVQDKCGEYVTYPATNAIDGDLETSWFHYATCYHWIAVDLGATETVARVLLYQSAAFGWGGSGTVSIYVSDDPEAWGDAVWSGSLSGSAKWVGSGTFREAGRYVKLLSSLSTAYQFLPEFLVGVPYALGEEGPKQGHARTEGPKRGNAGEEGWP